MSLAESRGGWPHIFRESITTTGRKHQFPFICKHLTMRAVTYPCRVYFTEADFTANVNYILVPVAAAETPHGQWSGPVEAHTVWLKGLGGTAVLELVAFQRRA